MKTIEVNERAMNAAMNSLLGVQQAKTVKDIYTLLAGAEAVAFGEGDQAGYERGFKEGWREGYDIGYEQAVNNCFPTDVTFNDDGEFVSTMFDDDSTYEDVDVAQLALDLDGTLSLPAYEGDSGDEG